MSKIWKHFGACKNVSLAWIFFIIFDLLVCWKCPECNLLRSPLLLSLWILLIFIHFHSKHRFYFILLLFSKYFLVVFVSHRFHLINYYFNEQKREMRQIINSGPVVVPVNYKNNFLRYLHLSVCCRLFQAFACYFFALLFLCLVCVNVWCKGALNASFHFISFIVVAISHYAENKFSVICWGWHIFKFYSSFFDCHLVITFARQLIAFGSI